MVGRSRFLAITWDRKCGTGLVAYVLTEAGCEVEFSYRKDRYQPRAFDASRHIGLVILGDGQKFADHKIYEPERTWLRSALENRRAVLGICHGAQLIADACGGKLHKKTTIADKGLTRLKLAEEGRRDPVVCELGKCQVFQEHSDTFEIPKDAVNLAVRQAQSGPTRTHSGLARMSTGFNFTQSFR